MQEKQFVQKGARRVRLHEYLEEELEGAGYSEAEIVRTPTSTKIIIHAQRPGLVIGRGGSRIQELTEKVEEDFGFENPQIEVNEIENGDADAEIVAKSMASWLEKGGQPKRVGYTYLRRMKEAGVIGAEVEVSGKLSGNRGRTEKFSFGYVKRCGNTSKDNVSIGYELARTKPGAIGVKVRIMEEMPEFMHRDVDVEEEIMHQTQEHGEQEPKPKRIEKVIANAENMTAAAIEEAQQDLENTKTDDLELEEIREEFEERGDQIKQQYNEDDGSDGSNDNQQEEEETQTDSGLDPEEVAEMTVSDAKDTLRQADNPDYQAVLQAEQQNKDRKTLVSWLENKVEA